VIAGTVLSGVALAIQSRRREATATQSTLKVAAPPAPRELQKSPARTADPPPPPREDRIRNSRSTRERDDLIGRITQGRNEQALTIDERREIESIRQFYAGRIDKPPQTQGVIIEHVDKRVHIAKILVRDLFRMGGIAEVAGCVVLEGTLTRDSEIWVIRQEIVIYKGRVRSLRRFKDEVTAVEAGIECGLTIRDFADFHKGDILHAFRTA